jgi:hypothetical protein
MRGLKLGILLLIAPLLVFAGGGCATAPYHDETVVLVPVHCPNRYPPSAPVLSPPPAAVISQPAERYEPIDRGNDTTLSRTRSREQPTYESGATSRTEPLRSEHRQVGRVDSGRAAESRAASRRTG